MTYKCDRCGHLGGRIIDGDKILCADCYNQYNTCLTCQFNSKCEFETNVAPIPKTITQRMTQTNHFGVVEQIIHVPNPTRIKAFCIENECPCLKLGEDGKYRCMHQFRICEEYLETKL